MKIKTERKLMNFINFFYLLQGIRIYKKSLRKKGYIEKIQQKRLSKFILYAYSFPFYKKRFDDAGVDPVTIKTPSDLLNIPPITKSEYREWIESELSVNPDKYKYYIKNFTSGSTGMPLQLMQSPKGAASDIANLYRALYIQNRGFRIFRDSILHICVRSTNTRQSIVQKLGFFRYFKIGIDKGYACLVNKINTVKPDCIMANKTILSCLIDYVKAKSIMLYSPKIILSMGEKLDDVIRQRVNDYFQKEIIFDSYGSAETGNFAIETIGHKGIHTVWHDTHVIQLLNSEIKDEKNLSGEILVTPLRHTGFPLINYRLGDGISYKQSERGEWYIGEIYGRLNDVFVGKDDKTYTAADFMNVMNAVMRTGIHIKQYRIIKDRENHIVWYIAIDEILEDNVKKAEDYITQSHLSFAFDQDFSWCNQLPPDENGKLRILIDKSGDSK